MNGQSGFSGSLFPMPFVAGRLCEAAGALPGDVDRFRGRLDRWWHQVEGTCGPATGLRALFDRVAMPLAGLLGFSALDAVFRTRECRVVLETPGATRLVLVLLPWAERASLRWRDLAAAAREVGASWAFLLAPPFLTLVDVRGFAVRRTFDVTLPVVVRHGRVEPLLAACHATAFDPPAAGTPPSIEQLATEALAFQAGVRVDLQVGVADALRALTEAVRLGGRSVGDDGRAVPAPDQGLTLVFRILFLLFAESRGLVPHIDGSDGRLYAMGSLCREALAEVPRASLWDGLAAMTRLSRLGCRSRTLVASAFNGQLFSRLSAPALERPCPQRPASRRARERDRLASQALVALGTRPSRCGREPISYRDLGVEQLGAVYERLLDLERPGAPGSRAKAPAHRHSAARKESGTFYTPQSLTEFVVRRTLEPLVAQASSEAILALRIVDPAMGSGAFLVAACRYLAHACARALVAEGQLAPEDLDEAEQARIRRMVAERCLAGVDSNPVAVQLARLSLWLATLAKGKPLGFLDHRLRVGDSLVGAGPEELARPPTRIRSARGEEAPLFDRLDIEQAVRRHAIPLQVLLERHDETVSDVHDKARVWRQITAATGPLGPWRRAATLWCARWFWPSKDSPPPSAAEVRALLAGLLHRDRTLPAAHVDRRLETAAVVGRTRAFFHWPLEFPDVFYGPGGSRSDGGFDAVVGNPPWEMLRRDGRGASDEDRQQMLRFIRDAGLYPSCDRGHLNLYQPFLERALALTKPGGRVGLVLPWGLAVDDGAASLRERLLTRTSVETVVGLDNRAGLFPIHRGLRFLALVTRTGSETGSIHGRFGVSSHEQLDQLPARHAPEDASEAPYPIVLTRRALAVVGGSTRRIPYARRPADVALLTCLAAAAPRFGSAESWRGRFGRELNATESRPDLSTRGLPVVEGKHLTRFRLARDRQLRITREAALRHVPDGRFDRPRLGYRDVSGAGNQRSLIAAVIPAGTITTHTVLCLRTAGTLEQQHFLAGLFNSFVLNAAVRLLMSGHVTTTLVEDLPVPAWHGHDDDRLLALLAEELSRRPDDAGALAALEARVARRYGIEPAMFEHVLSGFPLVAESERERALAALVRLGSRSAQRREEHRAEQREDEQAGAHEDPVAAPDQISQQHGETGNREHNQHEKAGGEHGPAGSQSGEPKHESGGEQQDHDTDGEPGDHPSPLVR